MEPITIVLIIVVITVVIMIPTILIINETYKKINILTNNEIKENSNSYLFNDEHIPDRMANFVKISYGSVSV